MNILNYTENSEDMSNNKFISTDNTSLACIKENCAKHHGSRLPSHSSTDMLGVGGG